MTDRIDICFFSGTGNTRLVAGFLCEALKAKGAAVILGRIEEVLKGEAPAPKGQAILGIGYAVHGFGAPKLVFDFIRKLPKVDGGRAFVFATAGDDFWLNHAACAAVARRLKKKGYDVFHETLIPMPSNVAIRYPASLMKRLCVRAEEESRRMAGEIAAGTPAHLKPGFFSRLLARILNMGEHCGSFAFGKDLRVSKACTLCGLCVKECPVANITRKGDRIRFGWRCIACFRCVYNCPAAAIMPRIEKFAVLKGGYDIDTINTGPEARDGFFDRKPGWLYKRLRAYVDRGSDPQ